MSFVHPGLLEELIPRTYVVDLQQMVVVVQFEIRFRDVPSGTTWPPLQASAHYHLVPDAHTDLKIQAIKYWTEALPPDLMELWARRREEAFAGHALRYIQSRP